MLPILPTMGVGSYASPGWLTSTRKMINRGELGASDVEELFEDALTVCISDQLHAGVDILTDGELRRQRFVFELYDAFEGLQRIEPSRRLGVTGYDMAPHFARLESLSAPKGLGIVEDYKALKRHAPAGYPLKISLPGPLTFARFIKTSENTVPDLLEELVFLIRAEVEGLVAEGAEFIQLDEPGLTNTPFDLSPMEAITIINETLYGVSCRSAVHICFGNNSGRPFANRSMQRLVPAMEALQCSQLVLEFANREMAELEILSSLSKHFEIAAGVIDVKSFYLEPSVQVADRIRQCLGVVPVSKLSITADCGFSALPRYLARDKLIAMVAGTELVRNEISSS